MYYKINRIKIQNQQNIAYGQRVSVEVYVYNNRTTYQKPYNQKFISKEDYKLYGRLITLDFLKTIIKLNGITELSN